MNYHESGDLVISILARCEAGGNIENPRQVPAFHYSNRFGPVPPSFVRATAVDRSANEQLLCVAGTASVVGEVSLHEDDLHQQLCETTRNLATICRTAQNANKPDGLRDDSDVDALSRYAAVRAYVRHREHADEVEKYLRIAMPNLEALELVRADICRLELLVEIEGIAGLPTSAVLG